MTTEDQELLDALHAEFNVMLDPLDIPRSWTPRELDTYEERRALLQRRISNVELARRSQAEAEAHIAELTPQREDLSTIRVECVDELAACSQNDTHDRSVQRNIDALKKSILAIDGQLDVYGRMVMLPAPFPVFEKLKARGYLATDGWNPMRGSLPALEAKLEQLQKKRDDAQAVIDSVLRQAV
jgi:hypothetical protein